MQYLRVGRPLGAVALGLLFVSGAYAQGRTHLDPSTLVIDDSVPGELTLTWQDFEYSGQVTAPVASPLSPSGSWTVAGETATALVRNTATATASSPTTVGRPPISWIP